MCDACVVVSTIIGERMWMYLTSITACSAIISPPPPSQGTDLGKGRPSHTFRIQGLRTCSGWEGRGSEVRYAT